MIRTTPVRFTLGPLGLVSADSPYKFAEEVVNEGDHGDMIVQGELPFSVPEGWVLVKVGELYAPVHPGMVEAVRSA